CVAFLSQHYATKLWTNHEREAAQARAFQENEEYILPIRLDDTSIPGLLPTVAYLNWSATTPDDVAELIEKKLGR
ncbi:MAG: TIR domain-containing protein, partial [Ktedonobacteraceae bacterium]|nr:TIR domain-containing protein [Ktedonobacteraceae bacterium]MBV9711748.1 TIR domain-containing protein [Ktedonobacteraceae bacterium]